MNNLRNHFKQTLKLINFDSSIRNWRIFYTNILFSFYSKIKWHNIKDYIIMNKFWNKRSYLLKYMNFQSFIDFSRFCLIYLFILI